MAEICNILTITMNLESIQAIQAIEALDLLSTQERPQSKWKKTSLISRLTPLAISHCLLQLSSHWFSLFGSWSAPSFAVLSAALTMSRTLTIKTSRLTHFQRLTRLSSDIGSILWITFQGLSHKVEQHSTQPLHLRLCWFNLKWWWLNNRWVLLWEWCHTLLSEVNKLYSFLKYSTFQI